MWWINVLSIAGSIASILALPSLGFIYWELYRARKAAQQPKGVSDDCLEFLCGSVAINLVPLASLRFLPRVGDEVMLPSETGESGAGAYEVTDVSHGYDEDYENPTNLPCPARLGKIVARVRRKGS